MPNYDTDSELKFEFNLEFYAATSGDADTIAKNTINRIFGAACAGLMQLGTVTNVALSGQDISGANYVYPYTLQVRMGGSTAATPFYNTLFAATAADALAVLQADAQRVTNLTSMPLRVLYLKT
jgi:hypothetical protein